MRKPHTILLTATALSAAWAMTACTNTGPSSHHHEDDQHQEHQHDHDDITPAEQREVAEIHPRAVISHEGGLITLDTATGEVVHEVEEDGFFRLNDAGDGRHILVSAQNEFRVFNAGVLELPHGDHSHYYESDPGLTGAVFPADHPGHVVHHADRTALFSDGSGEVQIFTTADLAYGMPQVDTFTVDHPHHGVALELSDGTVLTTQGTEEHRDTIQHRDGERVLAETSQCPGVHGEAVAAPNSSADVPDVVVFGCENGPLVFSDGQFHEIDVDTDYQRSGNLAGTDVSPIMLGDHKTDPDADIERPTSVILIDTENFTQQTVDLGSSYWFRSLARGPEGEAVVLTYDGNLTVIDETTAEIVNRIPVIEEWEEHTEWQRPGPLVTVAGELAYVTDAAEQQLVVVDLPSGEVVNRFDLDVAPVEMAIATGLSQ